MGDTYKQSIKIAERSHEFLFVGAERSGAPTEPYKKGASPGLHHSEEGGRGQKLIECGLCAGEAGAQTAFNGKSDINVQLIFDSHEFHVDFTDPNLTVRYIGYARTLFRLRQRQNLGPVCVRQTK